MSHNGPEEQLNDLVKRTPRRVGVVRKGTSIHEFLAAFPDSDSCLQFVFDKKYDKLAPCPNCGRSTRWFRIRNINRYGNNCCGGRALYPLSRTVFANSNLPLITWFYAILHFCNTATGITTENLGIHLGISHKAAYRMGKRIRMHLEAVDHDRLIGGPGQTVYVDEDRLVNVRDREGGTLSRQRIVTVSDGHDFAVIPVAKGKFHAANKEISRRIHSDAQLEFRKLETINKLSHYRNSKKIAGFNWALAENPYKYEFNAMVAMTTNLKKFILRSHIWVSSDQISHYIAHFEFIYRRRQRGETIFWDAISQFPNLAILGHGIK